MRLALCIILLWAGTASAKDLRLYWTNPTTNVVNNTDSCLVAGDTPLSRYEGTDLYVASFGDRDTLYARIPGSKGAPDSAVVALEDSVTMGVAWVVPVNGYRPSCGYASTVWVKPNVPLPPPPPPDTTTAGLVGSYYASASGDTLQWGIPVLVRRDSTLDFSWGSGSPGPTVPVDNFRARWLGKVTIPTSGFWYFYLDTDDGARLWIDGYWLLSWWGYGAETEQAVGIELSAGAHTIRVDYLAGSGNAVARLRWAGLGTAKQIVPSSSLSH